MKEQRNNDKLFYPGEYMKCGKYLKEISTWFILREFPKGFKRNAVQETGNNYLVLLLEGRVKLSCNLSDKIINAGEMLLLGKTSLVKGECLEDTRVLVLAFEFPLTRCGQLNFQHLAKLAESIDYHIDTLPIKYPVRLFCEFMTIYLRQEVNCMHLHEIKHNELFYCLQHFYTRHELARLLYPMLSGSLTFQSLILENYSKVRSVKELIILSNMSNSAFYDKFRRTFGVSAKQWLTRKKMEKMAYKASEPEMTVKKLMTECDFEHLSQFQLYCKRNFGCTPSMLIENAGTGNVSNGKEAEFPVTGK